IIMEDMPSRKPNAARASPSQLGNIAIKSGHVIGRIACPALAADVLIKAAVTVGHNVEPRQFLFFHVNRERIGVLFTKPCVHHGLEERAVAEILGIPAWSRERPPTFRG